MTVPATEIRLLTPGDISFGLRVGEIAGWNQLASDWQRLLNFDPAGCFLCSVDGQPAGTVTTTQYGTQLAWIGMMLVDPNFRRRGVASQLVRTSIDYLSSRGVRSIKLDATPAGREVYARLGFRDEWEFRRWEKKPKAAPSSGSVDALSSSHEEVAQLVRYAKLDLAAFGAERLDWLQRLAEGSRLIHTDGGLGMLRVGRLSNYLGPIVADSAEIGRQLVEGLLHGCKRSVFWDVPGDNQAAEKLARDLGFEPVRRLTRMWFGEELTPERPQTLFALADPCCG